MHVTVDPIRIVIREGVENAFDDGGNLGRSAVSVAHYVPFGLAHPVPRESVGQAPQNISLDLSPKKNKSRTNIQVDLYKITRKGLLCTNPLIRPPH